MDKHPKRCAARSKRSGQQCGRYPAPGSTVCHIHGAGGRGTRQRQYADRRAEQERTRAKALREADRMVAAAGVDLDPTAHLLDSLYRVAALVEVYGAMVAALDAEGDETAEKTGVNRGWVRRGYVTGPDGKPRWTVAMDPLMVQTSDKQVQLHPFVREYHAAIDRRAKFAKLALDAGVAERQVALAERQGALLAGVVRRMLESPRLGLSPEQRREGAALAAAEMRAIAAGVAA